MKSIKYLILGAAILLSTYSSTFANITLPKIFSNDMVLQRDAKLSIWGWGKPGEKVNVILAHRRGSTNVDKNGEWKVELNPLKAGGPYELIVQGNNTLSFKNVLLGDVWLCSGQSNMEMTLLQCKIYGEEIETVNNKQLRFIDIGDTRSLQEEKDLVTSGWKTFTSENIANFSAVAYFFAKEIYETRKIPLGIILCAQGGTAAEAWTRTQEIRTVKEFESIVDSLSIKKLNREEFKSDYEHNLKSWYNAWDKQDKGYFSEPPWYLPSYSPSGWLKANLPFKPADTLLKNAEGIVWFRRNFSVPAEVAGKPCKLTIPAVQDIDTTWINGIKVGSSMHEGFPRSYEIPTGMLKEGNNTVVVRVFNYWGDNGIYGKREDFKLDFGTMQVPLSGEWYFNHSVKKEGIPEHPYVAISSTPTALYNGVIAPLTSFRIKGVVWYQGENNAYRPYEYYSIFPTLIKSWRNAFQNPELPFIYTQLPNMNAKQPKPGEGNWAVIRDAQLKTLSLPYTAMAVTYDQGEADNVHPSKKHNIGKRLALAAGKVAYQEDVVAMGPIYKSYVKEGSKIRISFSYIGKGLAISEGNVLKGFAIAGPDKKFVWGHAKIENNTVVVWHENIQDPIAVRYAYADNPEGSNLMNKEGLLASPFKTDEWELGSGE